jgi:hypothetical protein
MIGNAALIKQRRSTGSCCAFSSTYNYQADTLLVVAAVRNEVARRHTPRRVWSGV